ncbi:unnamed protein product [Brassica oleracea var. botrytis]|uniref:Uncharacterized protein n=3 Tax=Brassica TaxID=3705 RepID=A0A0D3AYX9_BRAOL|nr:unnamed protein product [Brassica napus]CDY43579.1 BnaC02g16760D [Brassica napus]VDD27526.1 unnamed protein product [Brassica oleracea]
MHFGTLILKREVTVIVRITTPLKTNVRRRPQNAIADIQESHGQYEKNPYDEIKNLNGMIQMGVVENQLCFDLIESWLAKNPDAASFKRNVNNPFRELALFQYYHGMPEFKNHIIKWLSSQLSSSSLFSLLCSTLTNASAPSTPTSVYLGEISVEVSQPHHHQSRLRRGTSGATAPGPSPLRAQARVSPYINS